MNWFILNNFGNLKNNKNNNDNDISKYNINTAAKDICNWEFAKIICLLNKLIRMVVGVRYIVTPYPTRRKNRT
ncbi:hypothetical protein L9W92_10490 [Pelotomaculum terephthalicicum JT]|uniref:hypothetical protein n=1 Tax=Pelotomaculum TaxID=191373 RepID=UPI0009CCC4C6|nr:MULTISPECIES: hypothetical protein [Pelotomaculum]MCG9968479.1 hypothetical protein [Pelotomaculum terephthalicicum JT]OPX88902.1 MAG: hypothetical protein A4E54_01164 [Pelotomaculum sp. PtaB.Bin117]OPY60270.1 MAG: hypothetical protein A4E56_02794 [Pelotomaculum sp. PtaU1.Bin065]